MKKEKLKEIYQSTEVEIILFEFSDIVTSSGEGSDANPDTTGKPSLDDVEGGFWT